MWSKFQFFLPAKRIHDYSVSCSQLIVAGIEIPTNFEAFNAENETIETG